MISTSPPVIPVASVASGHAMTRANAESLSSPSSRNHANDDPKPLADEGIPLSYVHVPGPRESSSSSSSALSSFSRPAKLSLSTIGSPPRRISYCDDTPASAAGGLLLNTPAIFRLEPKFHGAKGMFSPPTDAGGRGRKRTAQSLSYQGYAAASRGNPPHCGGTSTSRRVEATTLHLQGLSLRSPGNASTATSSWDYASSHHHPNIDFRFSATSPGAATHSSFTACGSSSFSKVGGHANTTTSPCSNAETLFPQFGSFGSVVAAAQSPSCEMRSPHVEISSSSPRIVPLTVLTHDSVPAIPSASSNGNRHDVVRGSASGSSSLVDPRSRMSRGFNGMSPVILPVDSSSDECTSRGVETIHFSSASNKDYAFSDDYHMMTIRTPQRSPPPLNSVQYCPDSAASNLSIMHDSPIAASSQVIRSTVVGLDKAYSRNSPSAARTPLPKVSLTPRSSGASPSRTTAPFPEFPSPCPDSGFPQEPIRWPTSSNTLSSRSILSSQQPRPPPVLLLDICKSETQTTILDESCSLDLSVDLSSSSKIQNVVNDSDKQTSKNLFIPFPKWGHHRSLSKPKTPCIDTLPHDSLFLSKSKPVDVLNATADSTPSALTRVSLKDTVIEVGGYSAEHRRGSADNESLSDVDDDDFFLTIPSTLAGEKQEMALCVEGTMRQTKQPRLNHHGSAAVANSGSLEFLENSVRRRTSMTSFESNSSLLGTGFALSSTSLRGMDSSSNPNLFGMISNFHVQQGSSSCLTNGNYVHFVGEGMKRETSMASIGLDLDPEVYISSKSENNNGFIDVPAGRDLVTPPVMAQALFPPPLSPRFGSLKNESTSAISEIAAFPRTLV